MSSPALPAPRLSSIYSKARPWREVKELWGYRTLLFFLCWRDLKVRYRQTVLGAAWALAQPLFTMAVFTVLFGKIAKIPTEGVPYPLFSLAALIPWTYFSGAMSRASLSVVSNGHLLGKVYFPRLLFPLSSVIPGAADFAISMLVLLSMMLAWGYRPTPASILVVPSALLWLALLAFSLGLWFSAVHVRFRDVGHALPFGLQLWMYATPVIFPTTYIPEGYQWLLFLNPLTGILEVFRASLFGLPWNPIPVAVSALQTLALLVGGLYFFQRKARTFADVV